MSGLFGSTSPRPSSNGPFGFGSSPLSSTSTAANSFGFGSGPSLFSSNSSSTSTATATAANSFGFGSFASSSTNSAPSTFGFMASTNCNASTRTNSTAPASTNKSHATVKKDMTGLKDTEEDLKKRLSFLSEFVMSFKEQIHTDIQLKPNNGPSIPAHKALLAARSVIFKSMLDSDGFKAPPSDADTMTLSELNTEELESLLEFLYTGNLPLDKLEKHVYSLYVAADKYEIPYLQESCERYMRNSMNTSNAVDILEISDAHSNKTLKETTLNFIVGNMKNVVSTKKFEDFTSSNPHLCVQIIRAFVDAKSI